VSQQKPLGSRDDARTVFNAWAQRQRRPGLAKFTLERETLIRRRLGLGYSAEDLIAVFRWVWEADDERAAWMRGENPRTEGASYLGLDNLLTERRLGDRVQAALDWAAERDAVGQLPIEAADNVVRLGDFARYRTGQPVAVDPSPPSGRSVRR
jgi:hypothetical protein